MYGSHRAKISFGLVLIQLVNLDNRGIHDPSNFFHLAYPKIRRKSIIQPIVMPVTKGQNTPSVWFKVQGIFMPNHPAISVSIAIANDAIVSVNCS